MAGLIVKGCKRSTELFGQEPQEITVPYSREQLDSLIGLDTDWQIALGSYSGQVLHHMPSSPILQFMSKHPVIFPVLYKNKPLQTTCNTFTDGSSNGKAAILTKNINKVILTRKTSAQKAELRAVIAAFAMFADHEFNLFSDSQYVVRLFPHIETAVLLENKTTIFQLLSELQQQIWSQSKSFFVGHIRAHSKLPGPLHAYNELADALTKPYIATALEKDKDSHALHHQNASVLRCQFQILR